MVHWSSPALRHHQHFVTISTPSPPAHRHRQLCHQSSSPPALCHHQHFVTASTLSLPAHRHHQLHHQSASPQALRHPIFSKNV
ncbi:hypothetical protein HPP92_023838 [Vanilla planifolia]|uniref:Uncharacterized protein n=1 Tax=Vanilla planifolia TaxID=51239 RepID=A0A835PLS4_VANPL|nr:hypothetical protein HPP92_023838 [Vanilla planifolia]